MRKIGQTFSNCCKRIFGLGYNCSTYSQKRIIGDHSQTPLLDQMAHHDLHFHRYVVHRRKKLILNSYSHDRTRNLSKSVSIGIWFVCKINLREKLVDIIEIYFFHAVFRLRIKGKILPQGKNSWILLFRVQIIWNFSEINTFL